MADSTTPNLYHLTGQHLHVTFATSGIDGKPSLSYQDAHQGKSFRGDELRVVERELGTMVSVTLRATVDVGSTSFSLLMPRVRLAHDASATIHTYSITAVHSTPLAPQLGQGQLDTYTTAALHGTAQRVMF